jgi:SAM-dependent methyltransferase
MMPSRILRLPLALLAALLAFAASAPQTRPGKGPHDATAHHPFTDVEKWVKIFDDPERDAWQKPAEVAKALRLRRAGIVADIGAGTGYFVPYLAEAVGPGGWVLAVDTEPEMVRHLGARARKAGLANTLPILAAPDDPFLPLGRLDCVLIVNTYHHIDDRLVYFRSLRDALAPGGRLAIVDFHKRPLPVGPPPEHKLEREFVLEELRRAGWRLVEEPGFLPHQYFLILRPDPGPDGNPK